MKGIIYLIAICSYLGCHAQSRDHFPIASSNNTLLWKVSGHGLHRPSFLFGTFHLLCKEDINFSHNLRSALHDADQLEMELKMDDPNMMANSMKFLLMKDQVTIRQLVEPKQYDMLSNYFSDSMHVPFMIMENVKPYFLLALLYPQMMNCAKPSGIEEALLEINKTEKKLVEGLETMEFQSSIFDSVPYKMQASELIETIDSMQNSKKEFVKNLNYYKHQELSKLSDDLSSSSGIMKQYGHILIEDRNKRWVQILSERMKQKSLFVAVGAGHLPGQMGLIELLRKSGYTVEPIIN